MMAATPIKARTLPIGIDLGSTTIKLAQLRVEHDGHHLIAAGEADVASDKDMTRQEHLARTASTIRDLMKKQNFVGRDCVISLPSNDCIVRPVKLARVEPHLIPRALRSQLQNDLPYEWSETVVRHVLVDAETYEDGQPCDEAIAFCTTRETVAEYLKMAKQAKIDVLGINAETCAIVECFERLFWRDEDADKAFMFVDLGACTTKVAITHGPKMAFAANLEHGGVDFDHSASSVMNILPVEAQNIRMKARTAQQLSPEAEHLYASLIEPIDNLTQKLFGCMEYHDSVFRGRQIDRIAFIGGGAHDQRLCQDIASRMNIPAQIGNPMLRIKRDDVDKDSGIALQPAWSVAMGLSMGADAA